MREVIKTGRTVEDATALALAELGVSAEEAGIEVLELSLIHIFQQTVRIRRLPVAFQKGVLLRHQPGIPAQKRHIARIKLT